MQENTGTGLGDCWRLVSTTRKQHVSLAGKRVSNGGQILNGGVCSYRDWDYDEDEGQVHVISTLGSERAVYVWWGSLA